MQIDLYIIDNNEEGKALIRKEKNNGGIRNDRKRTGNKPNGQIH